MTITVVKGISSKVQAESSQRTGNQASSAASAGAASTAASAGGSVSQDAAVANVRSKVQSGTEKLRDYKQARETAGKVADDIRADGSTQAHGSLDALNARGHFG